MRGARASRRRFALVVAALLLLHLVPPRGGPEPFVFGVLPWTLAWSLAWMAAASAAVVWMTGRRLWPDTAPEHDDGAPPEPRP
ncbi:MAG: DUF3311 domain-containing protein [Nannocystaceae bacterium]|nr:DUF3311 domain-containing protein [Nannocystaceae bacterium]